MNALGYQRRVAALISRYGEDFSLVRGGEGRTLRGIFEPLDSNSARIYFDDNEMVGLLRPGLILHLDGTLAAPDPPLEGDVLTRDGRTYTVRKIGISRLAGTPLIIVVLLD